MKTGIGVILQARMGSTRLPGKVLKQIEGRPMLWHIIERLKEMKQSNELIIATTDSTDDRKITELAHSCEVMCFTGSEEDVLDRFYQVAKELRLKQIVRATGDNPLVDPEEADRLINLHVRAAADYSSNKSEVHSGLPAGVGVEVFSFAALEKSWFEGKREDHREHVDEYILQNRNSFKIEVLKAPQDKCAPNLNLTVDTKDDLNFMRDLYHRFYVTGHIVPVREVIRYLSDTNRNCIK